MTYRRWAYLIVGGALSVPYLVFAVAAVTVVSSVLFESSTVGALVVGGAVTLVVVVATSFLPVVRVLEAVAVRELLGDPARGADGRVVGFRTRARHSLMFLLHVGCGAVLSMVSLAVPVGFGLAVIAMVTGQLVESDDATVDVPPGWESVWLPITFVIGFVVLLYLVWGVGGVLREVAKRLLGMSAAERIVELERQTERLSERTRLARELHDSVGHALSVVTVQAGAARRTLHSDPGFTEQALTAIEESARTALDDLDHVLGLLRDGDTTRAPQSGLDDLPVLVGAARLAGADVTAELHGAPADVPAVVSREVYRILQECLTNAVRHAGRVPVAMTVAIMAGGLRATVTNPLGAARVQRAGGGRGLRGMAERAELLGGTFCAGPVGVRWEVVVTVRWGSR